MRSRIEFNDKNTHTMKKLFIVLALAASLFITKQAQAQLNIHAAYAPELIRTYTPTADTTLFFHGISFGLDWTFNLTDNLDLTAGAQYRMNFRDVSEHYGMVIPMMTHGLLRERQTLVDIPILLKYNIPVSKQITISPFAGPMLSWGIQGKTTATVTFPSNSEWHYDWYGDNGGIAYRPNSRFNVYAMAGLEFGIKRFTVSFGGRYGFLDLNKRNTGTSNKVYGFFASFGHTF